MKTWVFSILVILAIVPAACGKIGDPIPPHQAKQHDRVQDTSGPPSTGLDADDSCAAKDYCGGQNKGSEPNLYK